MLQIKAGHLCGVSDKLQASDKRTIMLNEHPMIKWEYSLFVLSDCRKNFEMWSTV